MSFDDNPFRVPEARVADPGYALNGDFVLEGRKVPAGNGWLWIVQAWELFKQTPGMWIGLCLLYMVMVMVLSILPIVSMAVSLFMPVLIGGIMIGCKTVDEGGELEIGHLFAGFSNQLGNLVLVGLFYLVGVFAIAIVIGILSVGLIAVSGGNNHPELMFVIIAIMVLIGVALVLPLVMAIWYAPPLVVFHAVPPFDAMKASIMISIKNFVPFLVYGLVFLGLGIVASLPCFLGWLVLSPIMFCSIYTSYRDMFIQE